MSLKKVGRKVLCLMFFTSMLCSSFSVFAQTPKGSQSAANRKPAAGKCSGAWTGVITYTRTHAVTDNKRTERISQRGYDTRDFHMKGEYIASVVVTESPQKDGSSVANAKIGYTMAATEISEAVEKNSCDQGKTWRDMRGSFTDKTEFTGNKSGVAANVNIGVNADGSYSVGVGLPEIMGKISGSKTSSFSGQCKFKEGQNETLPETEKRIDGNALTSDGRDRVDPQNANRLSGSYSLTTPGGMVQTISWNLRRCGGPLMITDVKFYHPLYPSPTSWIEVKDDGYTIDGNMVKVVATVVNTSGQSKSTHINFKELKENVDLAEGNFQVDLDPGEEREVEYVWDTSGYAWKAANIWNQPQPQRQIEVKIPDDTKTRDIMVNPKPVVVVPGLWSKPELVYSFLGAFKSMPAAEWTAEMARVSIGRTAAENSPVIDQTVRELQKKENAWHVDLVAHSTGGLMARSYVQNQMPTVFDGRPVATHLVMVGTPNMGTPCASGVESIFTRIFNRRSPSFLEVSIKNMKAFNQRTTLRNGTRFSILVGNGYALTCQMDVPGDAITPNRSAIWMIKDWKFSTVKTRHEDMLGQQANFMQIVNWLAIPPKGDHNPDKSDVTGSVSTDENIGGRRGYGAMYHPGDSLDEMFAAGESHRDEDAEPDFATGIKLAANQSADVEIPVTKGSRMSVTFLAPPNVSATLTDSSGVVVGKIVAGTPEAEGAFRTITVKKSFYAGTWKIKFENAEKTEAEIAVIAFIDFSSDLFREP